MMIISRGIFTHNIGRDAGALTRSAAE